MNRKLLIVVFCLLLPMPILFAGGQQVIETDTPNETPTPAQLPAKSVRTPAGAGKSVLQVDAKVPSQAATPAANLLASPSPAKTENPTTQAQKIQQKLAGWKATVAGQPLTRQQELDQVQTIEALRERMGGGVASRLRGVVDGDEMKRSFRQSLQELTSQQNQTLDQNVPASRLEPSGAQRLTAARRSRAGESKRLISSNVSSAAYRSAARHLEQAAAEFENAGNYKQADRLRGNAAEYWQAARVKN